MSAGLVTAVVIVVFVVLSIRIYWTWWRDRQSGFFDQFTDQSPIGLRPGERAVGAWDGERYYGPLVAGSSRRVVDGLRSFGRNLLPGRHWLRTQPLLRLRGAPLQVRLTDQDRLVVNVAAGWGSSLRPRTLPYGAEAKHGFEPLLESGPWPRARVETLEEAFPGAAAGHWTEPDRDRWRTESAFELVRVTGDGGPLVLWVEREAVEPLRRWSVARPDPATHTEQTAPEEADPSVTGALTLDPDTGAIRLPDGIAIDGTTTGGEVEEIVLGHGGTTGTTRRYLRFVVRDPDGASWIITPFFQDSAPDVVHLFRCEPGERTTGDWKDWTPEAEYERRDRHDEWLRAQLGRSWRKARVKRHPEGETRRFTWGEAYSGYDPRSAASTIVISWGN